MATNPLQQQLSLRHNVPGTVYVLHFEPAYKHARHYIGRTEGDDLTARPRGGGAASKTTSCRSWDTTGTRHVVEHRTRWPGKPSITRMSCVEAPSGFEPE
jgi:hypothetical protein